MRLAAGPPPRRTGIDLNLAKKYGKQAPPRKRADMLLVERGLFESRARAQAAIEAGLVTANGKQVAKPRKPSLPTP